MSNKPVIGLIGGMGSGKSRVAAELERLGGRVISGDQLGHEALRQPAIRRWAADRWGTHILEASGEVDRRRLAAIVFADANERRALEGKLFPVIERRFGEERSAADADETVAFIVLDAAVMLEAGWDRVCDWLVYIHAPRAIRLGRLAQQRGWSAKEVEIREQAQLPLTDKASRAQVALDNSRPWEQTALQIRDLLRAWGLAERSPS